MKVLASCLSVAFSSVEQYYSSNERERTFFPFVGREAGRRQDKESEEMVERLNGTRVRGGDLRRRDDKGWRRRRRRSEDEVRESWERHKRE